MENNQDKQEAKFENFFVIFIGILITLSGISYLFDGHQIGIASFILSFVAVGVLIFIVLFIKSMFSVGKFIDFIGKL